jgi:L-alanine-DL-glutamate epimerase-like enolase superfamily enzyme
MHHNLTPGEAIILVGELAPYRSFTFEDSVAPQSAGAPAHGARHVNIPIVAGERSYNIYL